MSQKLDGLTPAEKKARILKAFDENPVFRDQMVSLCETAQADAKMRAMTDAELAAVVETMRDETSIVDVANAVLDQAAERLRRANGGPLPDDTEDGR